ncbi:MAG: Com family DNA-binding transcriptional regulator [bacterium]
MELEMKEFRCERCNRLLAKIDGSARVEVKCPRCKAMNLHFTQEVYITIDEGDKEYRCVDPEMSGEQES